MAEGNTIMMIWKIIVPVATVILIMSQAFHTSNFTAGGGFMPYGIKGVFVALPLGVIFALEGFEQAAQIAGEARNPKRDIPIAVVGSMLVGAALYMALQICFIGALIGAIAVFSLIVFYYAVHSRLGPEEVSVNAAEAISDAHMEDLELEVPEPV
jgi:amino acid transporter